MIDSIRRYWIGLLVLMLIGLHASIVAVIRIQANQVKISQSCEVDLGSFYILDDQRDQTIHLRIHALVPVNHRLQSRQLIELNQFQVRQAIEEYCRQTDPLLLADPLLSDLKTQLMDILVQTVGETATEDVVITEFHPTKEMQSLAFTAPVKAIKDRKRMVITRQAKDEVRKSAHDASSTHAEEGHGSSEHKEDDHGHH